MNENKVTTKNVKVIDYFIIGVFMLTFYIGYMGQFTILNQYIYHRVSVDEKFVRNVNISYCYNNQSNYSNAQSRIQSVSARYNIFSQISCGIPSILVVLFSGAFSDLYGRKLVIIISWIGLFMGTIVNVLLIGFSGPLWIYVFGQFLSGLGGGYGAMLMGIFALVSDITGHHNRNFGIIIIEISLGISMIISQALLGIWLKSNLFFWPIITFGLLFSSSAIMWLFLKETQLRTVTTVYSRRFYLGLSLKKMSRLFYTGGTYNILLIFSTIAFFIHTFNFFGNLTLITVYLFGKPFCWNSETLGYYRSISAAIIQLGIICSFFLLKVHINEIFIIELGFVTNILSKLLFAIAPLFPKSLCDYLIYIASFDLFSGASVSLLRSVSSKLVSPGDYGTLFGMMSSLETLGSFFGGVTYNAIYDATFNFYYGFCYCFAMFILSVAFIIIVSFYVLRRRKGDIQNYGTIG